jgi:DNA-binding LacI/PurR family transcriptional regulator
MTVTSLSELAKLAGVSTATVSRALAGSSLIGEATRARIVELARDHGFRINPTARNLRLKTTRAIGVVLPLGHETDQHLSDPFFMSLLGPLADALADRGHDLLLQRVIPSSADWLDAIIDSGRVDGVILIGQSNQIDAIEAAAQRFRALVVWGAGVAGYRQTTVGSDNVAGGRLAVEHLVARGCGRLAFFGNPEVPEFAARYEGFRGGVAAAAGTVTGLLHPVHLTSEAAQAEIAAFLSANPPPDGIVAASDVIAMSALSALAERGLAVPHDVAVVGYDDVIVARHTSPPLTTVRQDVERGARLLVELLFERMAGGAPASVAMAPELVVRASA